MTLNIMPRKTTLGVEAIGLHQDDGRERELGAEEDAYPQINGQMLTHLLVNGRMLTHLLVNGYLMTYVLVNGRMMTQTRTTGGVGRELELGAEEDEVHPQINGRMLTYLLVNGRMLKILL